MYRPLLEKTLGLLKIWNSDADMVDRADVVHCHDDLSFKSYSRAAVQ